MTVKSSAKIGADIIICDAMRNDFKYWCFTFKVRPYKEQKEKGQIGSKR